VGADIVSDCTWILKQVLMQMELQGLFGLIMVWFGCQAGYFGASLVQQSRRLRLGNFMIRLVW
jgi:hypothetical protein